MKKALIGLLILFVCQYRTYAQANQLDMLDNYDYEFFANYFSMGIEDRLRFGLSYFAGNDLFGGYCFIIYEDLNSGTCSNELPFFEAMHDGWRVNNIVDELNVFLAWSSKLGMNYNCSDQDSLLIGAKVEEDITLINRYVCNNLCFRVLFLMESWSEIHQNTRVIKLFLMDLTSLLSDTEHRFPLSQWMENKEFGKKVPEIFHEILSFLKCPAQNK